LREVEGEGYEMVSLADLEGGQGEHSARAVSSDDAGAQKGQGGEHAEPVVDYASLRREAYSWPRLVAPPIKRSGHVVMDVCSANGQSPLTTLPLPSSSFCTHQSTAYLCCI
jgi:hypothetical protein